MNRPTLMQAYAQARARLLARRVDGHWVGELSSSALSTATAAFALAQVDRAHHAPLIDPALQWLADHQNADGGWGDTPDSPSNLSTTLLAWSALGLPGATARASVARAEAWLVGRVGSLDPEALARAVLGAYGKDRTFSVPILTMAALAGRLGSGAQAWRHVLPLPFELAVLPHRVFRFLRLPVVSYALPALVAMGQVRHHFLKPANPLARLARCLTRRRALDVLQGCQPPSGGFLEAAPLTSFVTMSLAAMGQAAHPAARAGVGFLVATVRKDGSWPIDTNLATWTSTLSVWALSGAGRPDEALDVPRLLDWLLAQQHRVEHPYTHAAPGGWAWTDLSGGVPDADDTAGALVVLAVMGLDLPQTQIPAEDGVRWLMRLQNSDGGIATFCRGWGRLDFDRSSPDLTAHALSAWAAWHVRLPRHVQELVDVAMTKAVGYLAAAQRPEGAWRPLWFGNQAAPEQANPTYGTGRCVSSLADLLTRPELPLDRVTLVDLAARGAAWLTSEQNADGSWGGDTGLAGNLEETAVASTALAELSMALRPAGHGRKEFLAAAARGGQWLIEHTEGGCSFRASPIGLYFARLWYSERLYPMIFVARALGSLARAIE